MSRTVVAALLAFALTVPAHAQEQAAAPATEGERVEQTMAKFRDDLQALETEVVSKSISLSADEASAFWPLFKRFQSEQKQTIDDQIEAVRVYADKYKTLTDADAVAYVNALLARDQQIHDLRVKYLAEYTKVIGQQRAARVIHLSRKLGLASQARLAEAIPLVR